MDTDDISKLVEFANNLVYEKTGKHLEAVEKDILRQTLQGKKLSTIQFPSYENSYVQRFLAPKLWNLLSVVAGEKVGKKTVKEVLQRLRQERYIAQQDINAVLQLEKNELQSPANLHSFAHPKSQAQLNSHTPLNGFVQSLELKNEKTTFQKRSTEPWGEPTRLLLNGHAQETSHAESVDSKKAENNQSTTTAQEYQSSSQTTQSQNPDTTKNSINDLPKPINLVKPGIPLLLSLGILGGLFTLSWIANWYGVKNHLAGHLSIAQFGYNWALKLNPLSAAAHYNQGATYEDQQNYDRAHSEYQLAIEGGLVEAYNNQARLYILEGNYDAAIALLRVGLPLAQDDSVRANMHKNRGWARLKQGRYDEAKLDLEAAIQLKSDRASAHCLLAQVVEHKENQTAAQSQWENCLGLAYQPNTSEEDQWLHLARQRLEAK